MGGWAEKAKATGGGSVEGVITDYKFSDIFPFGEDNEPDGNIYMLLDIMPEGADEPAQRSLYLGSSKFLVIEEDGKVLKSGEDGDVDEEGTPKLYDKGEVYKFVVSLEEAGFPAESRFPDPTEDKVIDLRGMIGTRLRITNEIDEAATKEFGKRKVTKGKHKGKEFNRTYTKVVKVLELPGEGKSAKGGKSAKADTKGKKAVAADDDDEADAPTISNKLADKFLKGLLGTQKDNKIDQSGLALAITRYGAKIKMDDDERSDYRKLITTEEYLTGAADRGVVDYDASSKKKIVSLAE